MAVLVEGISVVLRTDAIISRYRDLKTAKEVYVGLIGGKSP